MPYQLLKLEEYNTRENPAREGEYGDLFVQQQRPGSIFTIA